MFLAPEQQRITNPPRPDEVGPGTSTSINGPLAGNGSKLLALTASIWGAFINGLTGKTKPADNDTFSIMDSADSNTAKKVTLNDLNNYIRTKQDTAANDLYMFYNY